MGTDELTTEFYKLGGPVISIGPVPGRKSRALMISEHGSPCHSVVAYFQSTEAAESFKETMRVLLADRLVRE